MLVQLVLYSMPSIHVINVLLKSAELTKFVNYQKIYD